MPLSVVWVAYALGRPWRSRIVSPAPVSQNRRLCWPQPPEQDQHDKSTCQETEDVPCDVLDKLMPLRCFSFKHLNLLSNFICCRRRRTKKLMFLINLAALNIQVKEGDRRISHVSLNSNKKGFNVFFFCLDWVPWTENVMQIGSWVDGEPCPDAYTRWLVS